MTLLSVVERELRHRAISPSRFGRDAVRDPRLVHDLRRGREPGPRITARVMAFIAGADGQTGETAR